MALKPDVSMSVALATGTLVFGIYQVITPSTADIRTVEPGNRDVEASERQATWTAAVAVAGISLITKDPNPFIVGGALVIAMAWSKRHANFVNPLTGRASGDGLDLSDLIPSTTQQDAPAAYGYADDASPVAV